MTLPFTTKSKEKGSFVLLMLVFSAIFLLLSTALGSLIITQQKLSVDKQNRAKAFQIAETGLEYYKWFLAHFPGDTQNGTGAPGPYVATVNDPEGGAIGTYSLTVTGNTQCGVVSSVDIRSTGKTTSAPAFTRTVFGRYARPSVAEYAYILNSNVWAGPDRVITGKYHSNGGIRMDGSVNSTVSSAVATWLCTASFNCSPSANQSGVFGTGPNQQLWTYPVPQVDFAGITQDLSTMKATAVASGRYFAPSAAFGYHVTLNADGTYNVKKVTAVTQVWGNETAASTDWVQENSVIRTEVNVGTYTPPASCGLIFFEDNIWIEGVVKGKKTIVAADVTTPNVDRNVWLPGNITYTVDDGTDGLTLLGEDNVLIAVNSPDTMTLRGIFIAQSGHFGRNYYCTNNCDGTHSGSEAVPAAYTSSVIQTSLTTNGTIVSSGREGTRWVSGGVTVSGYNTRVNAYDRKLATNPPPLTPYTSSDYHFVEWREE